MKKIIAVILLLGLASTSLAAQDFYLRKGDTGPYYYAQVTDADGAVNLTGATITCTMRSVTGTVKVDTSAATITDQTNGYFEYQWDAADTDWAASFLIEFKISLGGLTYTVPTRDTAKVIIKDNFAP